MIGYGQHPRAYITFQARLTPEMKDKLARCAEALDESQTSLITVALREFFGAQPWQNSTVQSEA